MVHWVIFAADDMRAAEARASAERFREAVPLDQIEILGFRDGYFPGSWAEIKDRFEAMKSERDPDLILTHWGRDAHQDHRILSDLAWNTWRDHLILEYEIPKYDGDLGCPNLFVPVDEATARRKVGIIVESFQSQRRRSWFTEETFLGLMRLRAVEIQCAEPYAEAFHLRKGLLGPAASPR